MAVTVCLSTSSSIMPSRPDGHAVLVPIRCHLAVDATHGRMPHKEIPQGVQIPSPSACMGDEAPQKKPPLLNMSGWMILGRTSACALSKSNSDGPIHLGGPMPDSKCECLCPLTSTAVLPWSISEPKTLTQALYCVHVSGAAWRLKPRSTYPCGHFTHNRSGPPTVGMSKLQASVGDF